MLGRKVIAYRRGLSAVMGEDVLLRGPWVRAEVAEREPELLRCIISIEPKGLEGCWAVLCLDADIGNHVRKPFHVDT